MMLAISKSTVWIGLAFGLGFCSCVLAQDERSFDESEPPFAPPIQRKEKVKTAPKIEGLKAKKQKQEVSASNESEIQVLEQQLFQLVNNDRAKMGQRPLKINVLLSRMARAHAEDMMKKNYFSHINKEGLDAQERALQMGIRSGVYENIAYQQGDIENQQKVINLENDFMSEPDGEKNHRYNILHPPHTNVGVGIALAGDKLILVEEFTDSEPGADD